MQVLKALSDETRYMMVKMLLDIDKDICICEFDEFFQQDSSVLYRNIKKLEDAGVLETEKKGRKRIPKVKDAEAVRKLLEAVEELESEDLAGKYEELAVSKM